MKIIVHKNSANPTQAWEELSKFSIVTKIDRPLYNGSISRDKLRVVCMSDTHSKTADIDFSIPAGDIFIHAGDFTNGGTEEEVLNFNSWIGKLPHTYKIVIAGNHERTFDNRKFNGNSTIFKKLLTNCTYLEDSSVVIRGIKIYGSPWQPLFKTETAFKLPPGESCLEKWDMIPDDTDILVTHVPPLGYNDLCGDGLRAGCVELLSTVQQRVKPRYHVFGHIHEGYGVTSDNYTIYINASTCTKDSVPLNVPICFDICVVL